MDMTNIGKQVLIAREGRRLKAYKDSVGVWTIGIGVTEVNGKPVKQGMVITAAECDALFEKTLAKYVKAVNAALKVPMSPNGFDALCSVCYNIGTAGMAGSTFIKRINQRGTPDEIEAAIMMWKKPPEIAARRKAEVMQFFTPYGVELPRQVNTSKPIKVAATVSEIMSPTVPTPVIKPVIVPPDESGWGNWLFGWLMRPLFG